jgi:hypothetical protein
MVMNPRVVWRAANVTFVAVVILAAGLLGAALVGLGNPRPVGTLVWEDAPGIHTLDAPEDRQTLALSRRFSPPGTLELVARQEGGPGEAAYGLWWGEVRALVSGSGYLGVWVGEEPVYAWQPFPHVRGPGGSNHLQIVVSDNRLLVRLNDEFVVESDIAAMAPAEVGVIVETFGRGGAIVDFERFCIWEN